MENKHPFIRSDLPILKLVRIHQKRGMVVKWQAALVLAVFALALPAPAFTINVTYDSSVSSLPNAAQVESAFAVATQMFQNQYTNPITVNVTVYWGPTGPFTGGIDLGESQTQLAGSNPAYTYAQLVTALRAARTTATDSNAVASLPASNPTTTNQWWIPRAEAKALAISGLGVSPNDMNNDGAVGFANNVSFTFDPTNRAVPGKYDFIGVAEHEISEMLGRSYGLNYNFSGYVPYDLFRFTASGTRSFDPNATGVYFSIDNGVTQLKLFYDDVTMGDIQDWATSATPDSYDAFTSAGHLQPLSTVDITTLDILGYSAQTIPSPRLTGAMLANGAFWFSFTNTPGVSYTVLASTNLSLSVSNWTILGPPVENPAGHFQFTDSQSPTNKLRFYRVSSP